MKVQIEKDVTITVNDDRESNGKRAAHLLKDEIVDVPEEIAKAYDLQPVNVVKAKLGTVEVETKMQDIDMDLNGDGVFDKEDVSIGAKAMAKGRKGKNKK